MLDLPKFDNENKSKVCDEAIRENIKRKIVKGNKGSAKIKILIFAGCLTTFYLTCPNLSKGIWDATIGALINSEKQKQAELQKQKEEAEKIARSVYIDDNKIRELGDFIGIELEVNANNVGWAKKEYNNSKNIFDAIGSGVDKFLLKIYDSDTRKYLTKTKIHILIGVDLTKGNLINGPAKIDFDENGNIVGGEPPVFEIPKAKMRVYIDENNDVDTIKLEECNSNKVNLDDEKRAVKNNKLYIEKLMLGGAKAINDKEMTQEQQDFFDYKINSQKVYDNLRNLFLEKFGVDVSFRVALDDTSADNIFVNEDVSVNDILSQKLDPNITIKLSDHNIKQVSENESDTTPNS